MTAALRLLANALCVIGLCTFIAWDYRWLTDPACWEGRIAALLLMIGFCIADEMGKDEA